ncbi:ATP-binding protein [Streptomyces spectabilis]|uniref:ATP-binding protein n=1 Tax=Streptomyces spectabilis TaxID=68270 RepID=UPI0033C46145
MTPITDVTAQPQQPLQGFEVAFLRQPVHVAHMRHITAAHLCRWGLRPPLTENVVLAVSELVTNAVLYGHGPEAALRVRFTTDTLLIEVNDENPAPAAMSHAGEDDERGRGLFLLSGLTRDWGARDGGTTTWCSFVLSEDQR